MKSRQGGIQSGHNVQQLLSNLQPVPPVIKQEPKFEIVETIQNMSIQQMIKQEPKFEIVDTIQNIRVIY